MESVSFCVFTTLTLYVVSQHFFCGHRERAGTGMEVSQEGRNGGGLGPSSDIANQTSQTTGRNSPFPTGPTGQNPYTPKATALPILVMFRHPPIHWGASTRRAYKRIILLKSLMCPKQSLWETSMISPHRTANVRNASAEQQGSQRMNLTYLTRCIVALCVAVVGSALLWRLLHRVSGAVRTGVLELNDSWRLKIRHAPICFLLILSLHLCFLGIAAFLLLTAVWQLIMR